MTNDKFTSCDDCIHYRDSEQDCMARKCVHAINTVDAFEKRPDADGITVTLRIPREFVVDYVDNRFEEFFRRIRADIDYKHLCGRYEDEIVEMMRLAFATSESRGIVNTNLEKIKQKAVNEMADFICSLKSNPCENYDGNCTDCMRETKEWLMSKPEEKE